MTLATLDGLPDGAAFDVVVVGAGGAGMSAALTAAIRGAKVALVERTEFVGGTTAFSAGTTWIPANHHTGDVGASDSVEEAAQFLRLAVGNHSSEALRRAFLEAGPKAIADIEAHSEVKFRARPFHPDYRSELEGSRLKGRALEPLPFDGRLLGDLFGLIRPPIPEFTVLGGMMVDRDDIGHLLKITKSFASAAYSARLIGRHLKDRLGHPRGTRLVMGNALIGRLLYSLTKRGVSIFVGTKVEEMLRDPAGAITGLKLSRGGLTRTVGVRGGVVMATGGFNRHPKKRLEMLAAPVVDTCPGAPGHTGEMHDLALALGAHYGTDNLDTCFWAPVSTRRRADGTTAVFPHFLLDRGKPGMITVDKRGRRFVNESTSYHLFVRGMHQAHRTAPAVPAFLITDADGLRRYGLGMVRPGGKGLKPFLDDGYLVTAPTLEALGTALGIDGGGLAATVATFNGYAKTGKDPDFQRGETDYQRANGDATRALPNPCLGAIGEAPFYAVRLWPGDIGAATGFVTDTAARVLDGDGQPIPGLYAVGNDMNSVMGGTYPGPGITIGPGITFGWLAAGDATERALRAA